MANHQPHVSVVMLNITKRPALPAGALPPFHSFLVKIVLSIAVIASKRSVPLAVSAATTHAATVEAPMAAEMAAVAEMVAVAVIAATIAILAGKIL